jgi:hypothetical protein
VLTLQCSVFYVCSGNPPQPCGQLFHYNNTTNVSIGRALNSTGKAMWLLDLSTAPRLSFPAVTNMDMEVVVVAVVQVEW